MIQMLPCGLSELLEQLIEKSNLLLEVAGLILEVIKHLIGFMTNIVMFLLEFQVNLEQQVPLRIKVLRGVLIP